MVFIADETALIQITTRKLEDEIRKNQGVEDITAGYEEEQEKLDWTYPEGELSTSFGV